MQRIQGLYYAPSPLSGRGVFTAEDIPKNTIIELAPIIEIPESEVDIIHHTDLHDYYFVWGEHDEKAAIALGYGSLYNHSYSPNANYIFDFENQIIEFFSIKNIKAGDEILINYHGDPKAKDEVWFDKEGSRIKRIKTTK